MRIKAFSLVLAVIMAFSYVAPVALAGPPQASQQATLYKRLGGYDALAAVTDDFLARMASDPQLSHFLTGHNTDSLKRIREHIVDFLCQATGGPCAYHGQNITATLDKFKVPTQEKSEVLGAVSNLKNDIVGH